MQFVGRLGSAAREKDRPRAIIWGVGCRMQTTTRDIEQMTCVCLCIRLIPPIVCPRLFRICSVYKIAAEL